MKIKNFFEQGVTNIEYAIIMGTVGLLATGGLTVLGLTVGGGYEYLTNELELPTPTPTASAMELPTPVPTPTPLPTEEPVEPEDRDMDDVEDESGEQRDREDDTYFYDDFADGDTEGWFPAAGKEWRLEDDYYCAGPVKKEHRSFAGNPNWTDYTVTVRAELARGKGFGVYFRATNPKKVNAYIFQYDPGYGIGAFLFRKVKAGRESRPFAVVRVPRGYNWYHQLRTVSVQVKGDTFTAFVDGQQVLQAKDSTYKNGQIGLRTWWKSEVCFDEVTVTPLK